MGKLSQALYTIGSTGSPRDGERGPRAPRPIAEGEGWTFWRIGSEVYRAPTGAALDTFGHPMGKRWECSRAQWDAFRAVFSWAVDV